MDLTRRLFVVGSVVVAVLAVEGAAVRQMPGMDALSPRIARLLERALDHDVFPSPVKVEFDSADEKLPEPVRIGKRLKEYMSAQPVAVREDEEFVGWMKFDGSVESDLFQRIGHRHFWQEGFSAYYRKPQDALATFEWQHSCIDFEKVVRFGIGQLRKEIAQSRQRWSRDKDRLDYLRGMDLAIDGIEARARNCASRCRELAAGEADPLRKAKLLEMAERCGRVPLGPAESFLDGVQSVYFCYDFLADSIGRLDQYLAPLYFADLAKGKLTPEQAKEALQELFIYIHAHTSHSSSNYTRTAESHMTVGGVTKDGKDGWTDFSQLVVESCMALDILRPEISFRWHLGTKRETLRFILDCERKDPNKRIALDGDVPRVEAYARRFDMSIEEARDYCMTGCNECIFPGGVSFGGTKVNALRCMDRLFKLRRKELCACSSWDEFRTLFEREFHNDIAEMFAWCDRFNEIRARDCNVLSALFLKGCIANAESPTRGGCSRSIPQIFLMGTPNLIDSLCVVKQFVFDERRCTMSELVAAVAADWNGYEALRGEIARYGKFYGTNDPFTNGMAQFVHTSLARFSEERRDRFGLKYDFGNLMGYNDHIGLFGAVTGATPDGRKSGETLSFGSGPAMNHGTDAATSQLLAAAKMDPEHVMCGGAIMNLTVSSTVVTNDTDFDKFVVLVETYFREGGIHLQLNHISRETLIDAQNHPEKYPDLRVRVSGFSGYFVRMSKAIQDEIIARTVTAVR